MATRPASSDADTQAVAGQLNRERDAAPSRPKAPPLELRCWPAGHDQRHPARGAGRARRKRSASSAVEPPADGAAAPTAARRRRAAAAADDGAAGGSGRSQALPDPASRSPSPRTARSRWPCSAAPESGSRPLYRSQIYGWQPGVPQPAMRIVKTRNSVSQGLGLPLPSGSVAMFSESRERPPAARARRDRRQGGRRGCRDRFRPRDRDQRRRQALAPRRTPRRRTGS